jgi:hypothetical protein
MSMKRSAAASSGRSHWNAVSLPMEAKSGKARVSSHLKSAVVTEFGKPELRGVAIKFHLIKQT